MEVKVIIIRGLDFLEMRDSGKGNRGSGVSIQLVRNGRQPLRLGIQIGSQSLKNRGNGSVGKQH